MQITSFMVTNGGPHPADKWADLTASTIVNLIVVKDDSVSPEALAARQAKRDLQPILFAIFNAHHTTVQDAERAEAPASMKAATARVEKPIDPMEDVTPTMVKVNAALAATPYAAHFAKPDVQAHLVAIIAQHTADVMHIERRYHHDRAVAAKGA
jgi:hypothetical protein